MTIERERLLCDNVDRRSGVFSQGGGRVGGKGGGGCAVYLSLGEVQGYSYLVPPESGQIIMDGELFLQLPDLVLGEGRPLFPRLDG